MLALAEGQLPGAPTAFFDLFRVEVGTIVEHWDVLRPIAPEDERQNSNGRFYDELSARGPAGRGTGPRVACAAPLLSP